MVGDADKDAREKFDKLLYEPPAGVSAEVMKSVPGWSPEDQGNDFMAALAARAARG